MTFGSYLYNLWAALISFSIYFFATFLGPSSPLRILIGSFVAAIIGFVIMFGIRFLISYILFTPNRVEEDEEGDDESPQQNEATAKQQKTDIEEATSNEFQDESTEEIAQVVRTMMNTE